MKKSEKQISKKWTRRLRVCGFISVFCSFSFSLLGEEAKKEGLFPDKEVYTREEVDALRKVLEQKSEKLDQDIETQKEYVESLKVQVEEHLAKIDVARNEIADFMNARNEKEENKLKKLARFYEAMDPEQASPHLQKVNDELAIKIFDRMDTKKAGGILALYPTQRAAKITAAFPRLRIQAERGEADGSN